MLEASHGVGYLEIDRNISIDLGCKSARVSQNQDSLYSGPKTEVNLALALSRLALGLTKGGIFLQTRELISAQFQSSELT